MRPFLTGLLALLLIGTPLQPLAEASTVEKVLQSVVSIEYYHYGSIHGCSGFIVNKVRGEVLTARHCIPDYGPIFVDGGFSYVIKKDEWLALLKTHPAVRPELEINDKPLHIAQPVTTFGFAFGRMLILDRRFIGYWNQNIILNGPLIPGMSGGPVVNRAGKVIGLNQATTSIIGLATNQEQISNFLAGKPTN